MTSRKIFWRWSIGFVGLELVSWLAYRLNAMAAVMIVVTLAIVWVGWRRPEWLAWMSFAELVVGGKGYLLFAHLGAATISLREIVFLAVVIRFGPSAVRRWKELWAHRSMRAVAWLALWVMVMTVWGLARGNHLSPVFFDVNAFFALAYLPLWWVSLAKPAGWPAIARAVLFAGATIVGVKSWLVVFFFGHNVSFLAPLYHWIRDTGIGEITLINANVYRVFFQSQLYDVIVWLLLLGYFLRKGLPRWQWIPLVASSLGMYISLSRSFWLGAAVALVILFIWLVRYQPTRAWRMGLVVPLVLLAWLMNSWAINFPAVTGHGQVNPVLARLTSTQSAQASTARLNQVRPLLRAIAHHPVMGNGFGSAVTYFSTDPRVRGWRTTTAFELGYLDLWLKIGLIGLFLYGRWVWPLCRDAWRKGEAGLVAATVALLVIHLTSPYLNHPLGISWLILVTLVLYA